MLGLIWQIGYFQCFNNSFPGFQSKNALFRHEIAYVLGQISSELSTPALTATLANVDEIGMVRSGH